MAGPLRRVSQNYQWTLKRADNDLHNSITPDLQPALSPNIESAVSPWDLACLQFKSEYPELREHFELSSLILLGWWLTIKHLMRVAAEQFIAHPNQAISNLYKKSTKLSSQHTFSISVWGLLATLFRYAVPRVAFTIEPFFFHSVNSFVANKKEETGTNHALSPSARRPLPDEIPFQSPHMESTSYAPTELEGSPTITVMSDPAHSTLDWSVMDAHRDGIEKLQSAMHIEGGRYFHGSPSIDGDIRKPHEYANEIAGLFDPH